MVHEAAVGTTEATLRGDLAGDLLKVVAPALDLLAYQADLTRESTNRELAARLGNRVVPLATALREVGDLTVQTADWLTDIITAALQRIDPDTAVVDLAEHLDDPPAPRDPVLCSIDMLPATGDLACYLPGSTPLVLGDIHDAPLLTPWALRFHPDSQHVLLDRDAAIEAALGTQTAVNVIPRRSTGLPPLEFPGLVLELGGTAADTTRARIGLDALQVRSDGKQAILVDRADPERSLLFHNGELDSGLHTALALPRIRRAVLPDLPHVPRLTWHNAVLSRRTWKLPSAEIPQPNIKIGETGRLVATARMCAARALPTRFFAKSPTERKPIFVDTATPSLLDALTRLAATCETLTVSEVLPTPEEAWLRDGELRFAAELRCVYLRKGANQT
ncbi:lantibiotic dehydratase family protein [Rhodococcus sp. 06-235-1A]|uniref:lantibiotic dehydratase family protein n=1 Tax=Rhodococcus sp. 06-235-1A TaxID=2022508 RepID=UPI001C530604|nr:lantibiotic dehydratase family protein [Rhodococcus sp. 06-235-1A]